MHGRHITLSVEDIDCFIHHKLDTGFFLLGALVGKEVEGLAMGGPLRSSLARMSWSYLDMRLYYSLRGPRLPPLGARGRARPEWFCGRCILVLEMRYMDDYLLLSKGPQSSRPRRSTS